MTFWNKYKNVGNEGSNDISYEYTSKIYIGSHVSERFIELPAYINELKYELNKDVEDIDEKDKTGNRYINKSSIVSLNLTIDVPAASAEEAKHNLIRVSEIMRMISPSGGLEEGGEPTPTVAPKLYILFSNLISRGLSKTPSFLRSRDYKKLKKFGLPCYVKDFTYDPDIEAGFFVDREYRAPRNIKVSFTASIATNNSMSDVDTETGEYVSDLDALIEPFVIRGFSLTGEYMIGDPGGFPFGIAVKDSRQGNKDFSYDQINKYREMPYHKDSDSYFVIGNSWPKQKGKRSSVKKEYGNSSLPYHIVDLWNTPVWCKFKMFLEDYKFTKKTGLEPVKIPDSDVGVAYKNYSDNNSEFDISFAIASVSLLEAQKNCAKIQVLMRLYLSDNEYDSIQGTFLNNSLNPRYIYSPNLIEYHTSNKRHSDKYKSLLSNAVACQFNKLSIDIDQEAGYFIEKSGKKQRYYPKSFKIAISCTILGGVNHEYAGRPGNYNKSTGKLERDDVPKVIQFPFKFN